MASKTLHDVQISFAWNVGKTGQLLCTNLSSYIPAEPKISNYIVLGVNSTIPLVNLKAEQRLFIQKMSARRDAFGQRVLPVARITEFLYTNKSL